uniref:Uncharacterized protein n=1 Tax=Compsopogon caeruleus TaxID=31354 RepID=A0A7S1XEE9_9RHOD|mmetsp:Transcript_3359/g.6314  ORF Transcript_3359/g.6314 Transcript_3359/m.6314 type:complete len:112 (+) Transcript_3359:312-647(+)|eukprot:CAMPEP_0184684442 /NCGR_PEP_ID=MMETSP0312-20130426/15275_1 /TAXON_ID=31354 /ORGANISM="Compsopogon coeruleus, Strain SAG 36.94" /LENGTH=111 /DNA_ID=CAMNT_0027137609 /DNA_START=235 /DNA_END=570 /DNA_ORIENTATION=-
MFEESQDMEIRENNSLSSNEVISSGGSSSDEMSSLVDWETSEEGDTNGIQFSIGRVLPSGRCSSLRTELEELTARLNKAREENIALTDVYAGIRSVLSILLLTQEMGDRIF